ncbi:hypothetical protein WOLCODRAFT_17604 [Wolfiporia cocos MD-104 SS10]|uniref:Uncharacterized protein n=1 Tax=Wolfiporia cocos (strain MD-104) TaxID=742152 RepID=A0A2H3JK96_WOLCO|nr:hypothetical protein WOLCODRAFT_17604 [Wolfiporia cocos MD-104 SS10]
MVFSIMGLFGVSLNPKAFHADDRIGATVALAKEILRQGKSASWLGISFHLPPCRQLSTFPDFPQTSVAGTARIMTHAGPQEVQKLVAVDYPNRAALPVSLPQGTMSDDGYLKFTCKAAPVKALLYSQKHEFPHADISVAFPLLDVKRVLTKRESSKWVPPNGEDGSTFTAADKTVWQLLDKNDASQSASNVPHKFAILLGWFDKYLPGQTAAIDRNIKLMVVEEHVPGRFHAVAGASLHHKLKTQVMQWQEYRFNVGGPEPLQADSSMLRASNYLLQDERTDHSDCEEHSERPARGILPEAFLYKRNAKYDPKKGFYWIEFKNVMVDPQSFTDDPEHLRSELLAWNTWLKPETVVATRYIQPISQPKNNRGAFKTVTVILRLTGLLHPMEDITTLYEVGLFIHGGRYRLTDFEDQSFVQFG